MIKPLLLKIRWICVIFSIICRTNQMGTVFKYSKFLCAQWVLPARNVGSSCKTSYVFHSISYSDFVRLAYSSCWSPLKTRRLLQQFELWIGRNSAQKVFDFHVVDEIWIHAKLSELVDSPGWLWLYINKFDCYCILSNDVWFEKRWENSMVKTCSYKSNITHDENTGQ